MKRSKSDPLSSEITPESLFLRRREFLKNAALAAGTATVFGGGLLWLVGKRPPPDAPPADLRTLSVAAPPNRGAPSSADPAPTQQAASSGQAQPTPQAASSGQAPPTQQAASGGEAPSTRTAASSGNAAPTPAAASGSAPAPTPSAASGQDEPPSQPAYAYPVPDEPMTAYESVSTYNNFYEFGLGKDDPALYASTLMPRPWTISVEGEVAKPQTIDIETLLKWFPLQERIYRMRCVEAWSMVIPWVGFPLGDLIKKLEPTSKANYVEMVTLLDPVQMPGQEYGYLDWPYVEGLRMDEALHPLTILAVGLYGKELPNQNGAPLRLVVPWKYGFKGVKSIVKIRFVEAQPATTWALAAPSEYGFYANVNPEVDHPRWSQASERRIGELLRRPTLPFNGYADEVAELYAGLDLRQNF